MKQQMLQSTGSMVQSELASAALYRDLVQIESDHVGVYLFLQRPLPKRPHK